MSTENDRCFTCGGPFVREPTGIGTGYAADAEGWRHCYACCALQDKAQMRRDGRISLYVSGNEVTNWPGTLRIPVTRTKHSKASAFGRRIDRTDVWFTFEGTLWHGVNKGDMQLCHCRRVLS